MVEIPSKVDGDILFAANLFKLIGFDNTGGSTTSGSDTVLSTIVLPAITADHIIILAGCRCTETSTGFSGDAPVTYRAKIDAVEIKNQIACYSAEADNFGISSNGVFGFVDDTTDYSTSKTLTITAAANTTAGQTVSVQWVMVFAVGSGS